MPINKQDATRALELLEDYHRKLNSPADIQLRSAIERVIKIFKSKLFNALLEIQEFYEATLLDDSKTTEQKTLETMKVAERWANSQGLAGQSMTASLGRLQQLTRHHHRGPASDWGSEREYFDPPPPDNFFVGDEADRAGVGTSGSCHRSNGSQQLHNVHAAEAAHSAEGKAATFEVTLERTGHGFGFSIAGGSDAPSGAAAAFAAASASTTSWEDDPRIRVTRIVPGGAADGRLAVGDALLGVNGVDVACVTHAEAVEALKLAGGRLRLLVLRQRQRQPQQQQQQQEDPEQPEIHVLLKKTARGLGFSIAGGVHNEHLPGDGGIFITKLIAGGAAQLDGRISVGDRLVSVNNASLRQVTHEEAVAALKRTGSEVLLSVVKPSPDQLAALLGMEAQAEAESAEERVAATAATEHSEETEVDEPEAEPLHQQLPHIQQQPLPQPPPPPANEVALEFAPDRRRNCLPCLAFLLQRKLEATGGCLAAEETLSTLPHATFVSRGATVALFSTSLFGYSSKPHWRNLTNLTSAA